MQRPKSRSVGLCLAKNLVQVQVIQPGELRLPVGPGSMPYVLGSRMHWAATNVPFNSLRPKVPMTGQYNSSLSQPPVYLTKHGEYARAFWKAVRVFRNNDSSVPERPGETSSSSASLFSACVFISTSRLRCTYYIQSRRCDVAAFSTTHMLSIICGLDLCSRYVAQAREGVKSSGTRFHM